MRTTILAFVLAGASVFYATTTAAGPPFDGTYKSSLGQFSEGRETTTWVTTGFLGDRNLLRGESWDGSTLGAEWRILCPEVVRVRLIYDSVAGGTGHRIYQIEYRGGFLELSGTGPWGNGDPLYTAAIDIYVEFRTVQYVDGVKVGSVSDHAMNGHFTNSKCFTWGIGNEVWLGEGKTVAAGYPTFVLAGCKPTTKDDGHWGDLRDLTLTIQGCVVGTEATTWGAVKAIYRN